MRRVFGKRAAAVAGAVGAAAALTMFGVFGASGAAPRTGPLFVEAKRTQAPGRFVRGNGLYDASGRRTQLGAAVSGALMGPLTPVAVASADGERVAYSAWRELRPVDAELSFSAQGIEAGDPLATPSLRVHDDSGADMMVARGAYSAAWRADGALAYVKGVDQSFRAARPYLGRIVVQRDGRGPAVEWAADPARYVAYAWAANRLLFYRIGAGESLELLVADRPGDVRPFADGSAVAVSPDGSRVMVVSPDATSVRILDVASGREQAWLDVTTASPTLRWIGYSGSWAGNHVVAPASSGLAVFRVGPKSIELEQVLSLNEADFPAGVQEPKFGDAAGNEIVATADVPPRDGTGGVSFFLDCDRVTRSCSETEPAPAREWPRLLDNPSRPEKGDR
jgi:hypothetical protein